MTYIISYSATKIKCKITPEHSGTVLTCSALTSSNIVGYQQTKTVKGTTYQGPTFVAMGTGKLSDLKVTGYTGDVAGEMVTISKISAAGVNTKDVIWLDYSEANLYGWYQWDGENDPVDCNEDELNAGDCLMVQIQDVAVGWSLQNAGQVSLEGVPVKLVKGTQYLASATPREATMGEIVVSGYTGDIAGELVTSSVISAAGVNTKDVIWLDYSEANLYGWYQWDGENDPVDCNEDPLSPGQGLMVQVQDDAAGWTITFPPAVKAE